MSLTSRAAQSRAPHNGFSPPLYTPSTTAPYPVHYGNSPSGQSAALSQTLTPLTPSSCYATVKQLAAEYKDIFTEGALRNLIWHAEAHARNPKPGARSNGFLNVIHRPGGARKVLLHRVAFAQWLSNGKTGEVGHG